MLEITVTIGTKPSTLFTLQQDSITLGSSQEADVQIEGIAETQFSIEKRDNQYFITNHTTEGDSSATLNDGDFEEAILTDGTTLSIQEIKIAFSVQEDQITADQGVSFSESEEDFDIEAELAQIEELFETEENPLVVDEEDELDIDALFDEVMKEVDAASSASSEQEEENSQQEEIEIRFADDEEEDEINQILGSKNSHTVLPEKPLSNANDNTSNSPAVEETITIESHTIDGLQDYEQMQAGAQVFSEGNNKGQGKKYLIQAAVVLFAIFGIISSGLYFSTSKKNQREEKIASEGLVDLSMACLHAQTTKTTPEENNWLKSSFLNEQLSHTLSAKQRARSFLTQGGVPASAVYNFSIIHLQDNHTLLTAIPKRSFQQFFVPKKAYLIDLATMQLKETSRSIGEQVLQRAKKEHSPPSKEIGSLISMSTLAEKLDNPEFSLPYSLVDTEADHYIYNAPRYYRFAKDVVERLIVASDADALEHQKAGAIALYQQFIERFPYLVLYSRRGQKAAKNTAHSFSRLSVEQTPVAFLAFEPSSGTIKKAVQVLPEETQLKVAAPPRPPISLPEQEPVQLAVEVDQETLKEAEMMDLVDTSSQLFATLNSLQGENEEIFQENALVSLEELFEESSLGGESEKELYKQIEHSAIKENIAHSYQEYMEKHGLSQKSLATFSAHLKATELFAQAPAEIVEKLSLGEEGAVEKKITETIDNLLKTNDLYQIEQITHQMQFLLHPGLITDQQKRHQIENDYTKNLLDKIAEMLLSPKAKDTPLLFTTKNRSRLTNIMNQAKISDRQETEFYLQEFDLLVKQYHALGKNDQDSLEKIQTESEQIPLSRIASDDLEDPRSQGRLGQQLLIQAAALAPSEVRDEKLHRAIGLLERATLSNRALWLDLLQARNLLTQTPRDQILQSLYAPLGFFSEKGNLFQQMHAQLTHYVFALQRLNEQSQRGGASTRFAHFQREQEPNLEQIITLSEDLEKKSKQLLDGLSLYALYQENYIRDYNHARSVGMFTTNPDHHEPTLRKLEKNQEQITELLPKFSQTIDQIVAAAQSYKTVATTQKNYLKKRGGSHARRTSEMLKNSSAHAHYPDLQRENLGPQLALLLDDTPSPLPEKNG